MVGLVLFTLSIFYRCVMVDRNSSVVEIFRCFGKTIFSCKVIFRFFLNVGN